MTRIMLITKPNRNGNRTRLLVSFSQGEIAGVELNPESRYVALAITVAPSEIKELVAMAKRHGVYRG